MPAAPLAVPLHATSLPSGLNWHRFRSVPSGPAIVAASTGVPVCSGGSAESAESAELWVRDGDAVARWSSQKADAEPAAIARATASPAIIGVLRRLRGRLSPARWLRRVSCGALGE